MLFIGFVSPALNLKGQPFVAYPILLQLPFSANASGEVLLSFTSPSVAATIGLQAVAMDPSQPQGIDTTNAIEAVFAP